MLGQIADALANDGVVNGHRIVIDDNGALYWTAADPEARATAAAAERDRNKELRRRYKERGSASS